MPSKRTSKLRRLSSDVLQGSSAASGLLVAGASMLSFGFIAFLLCQTMSVSGDQVQDFYSQVPKATFSWGCVAFLTAFFLNFLALPFQHRATEIQVCAIACSVQLLAAFHSLLNFHELAPVLTGPTGKAVPVLRFLMWLHTTPQLLFALSIMSDIRRREVSSILVCDFLMILAGMTFELSEGILAATSFLVGMALFPYVLRSMWRMFNISIVQASVQSQTLLHTMQFVSAGLWASFPALWLIIQMNIVSLPTSEVLWCFLDFCGKAVFSTCLLYVNYATMEQQRLVAMTVVAEGNRVAVVHELRELVARKDGFTAAVSHELRNPLCAIIRLAETVLSEAPQAADDISCVHSTAKKLLMLVNNILAHAEVQSVRLVIQPHKVNLHQLVHDMLQMTGPLAAKNVQLINNIPENAPHIYGDLERLQQVLYNVLSNACKFTEKGSIWVDAKIIGDKVLVSVHDTGVGIPADKLPSIFGDYEQLDMSTTRSYGGTGLGLCVVKQMIEAHGGLIDIASERYTGTTITFSLQIWNEKDPQKNVIDAKETDLMIEGPEAHP